MIWSWNFNRKSIKNYLTNNLEYQLTQIMVALKICIIKDIKVQLRLITNQEYLVNSKKQWIYQQAMG